VISLVHFCMYEAEAGIANKPAEMIPPVATAMK
jgi:hypothetical protein